MADKKQKPEATDPISQEDLVAAEMKADGEIVQRCLQRFAISRAADDQFRSHWELYENFWLGCQYAEDPKAKQYNYNSDGKRIMVRQMDEAMRDDMPKRTQNKIFPMVQSQQAILAELNPTITSVPYSDKQSEKARRQNLFNKQVFNKDSISEYLRSNLDAILLDRGFMKVGIKPLDPVKDKGKIPFYIRSDSAKTIWADPNADRWEDVRWVIHEIKRYAYEVKERYPKFDFSGGTTEIVSYHEYFIMESEGVWNQYVIYGATLLSKKKIPYPCNLYECFTLYQRVKGWNGISEVGNWIEYQKVINKRASQLDWHIGMMIDPPTAVTVGLIDADQAAKLPLRPGVSLTVKQGGAVSPIQTDNIGEATFFNTISQAENSMEDIAGVPKSVQGRNEQGVYSAKHFSAIQEAAYVRIRLKEFHLKKALESLAKKIYKLAEEYLGDDGYFEVYDTDADAKIKLTKKDFDISDMSVQLETTEANLIDPSNRLTKMIELMQYTGDKWDVREFFRAIENTYHGFLGTDFMKNVEASYKNPAPAPGGQPPAGSTPPQNPPASGSTVSSDTGSPSGEGGGQPTDAGNTAQSATPIQDVVNKIYGELTTTKKMAEADAKKAVIDLYTQVSKDLEGKPPADIAAELLKRGEQLIGGAGGR